MNPRIIYYNNPIFSSQLSSFGPSIEQLDMSLHYQLLYILKVLQQQLYITKF